MNFLPRQSKLLIWSLCIALLAMRFAGAHWHLCFDGSEPPTMVHVGDGTLNHHDNHHADRHAVSHSDVDLNLIDDGLLKLLGKNLALAVALVAAFMLFLQRRRAVKIPRRTIASFRPTLLRTPPPRGPPL
jgi:hypothetical protein